uniref:Uncharacterized protein n=1 Tax=Streptomyces sp. HK1 TaxID=405041 RepID=B0LUC6_9ACTN|nr:unknown [Streptomyces sp. HK1]
MQSRVPSSKPRDRVPSPVTSALTTALVNRPRSGARAVPAPGKRMAWVPAASVMVNGVSMTSSPSRRTRPSGS